MLQCLKAWPLLNRNKVDDSTINVSLESLLAKHDSESFKASAQELLDHWSSLPLYKRIAKVKAAYSTVSHFFSILSATRESTNIASSFSFCINQDNMPVVEIVDNKQRIRETEERKRQEAERWEQLRLAAKRPERPEEGWYGDRPPPVKKMRIEEVFLAERRRKEEELAIQQEAERRRKLTLSRNAIIENAAQQAKDAADRKAAEIAEAAAKAKARQEKLERWEKRKADKAAKADRVKKKGPGLSAEEKEKLKEKRLLKLVGEVVVKCMSKYAKGLSKEMFKKYAKEVRLYLSTIAIRKGWS